MGGRGSKSRTQSMRDSLESQVRALGQTLQDEADRISPVTLEGAAYLQGSDKQIAWAADIGSSPRVWGASVVTSFESTRDESLIISDIGRRMYYAAEVIYVARSGGIIRVFK